MPDARIPTDREIRQAARLLHEGGFNEADPQKAAYADRLVADAGTRGGQVAARILKAAADLEQS